MVAAGRTAMELRPMTSEDLQALLSFYSALPASVTELFEPFGPRVTVSILQRFLVDTDKGMHLSFGLFDPGGIICGHAFIWNVDSELPVFGIGIAEGAQCQGWGRRMAVRVLAEADARGAKKVALTVLKANARAWTLYESLGFRRTGEATFRSENDSFQMERT